MQKRILFKGGLFFTVFFHMCVLQAQDVVISEFQAKNNQTVTDNYGGYPDWIELYNAGGDTVTLSGWFLTDDALDLEKWRFPAISMDPGEFLLVYASDKDMRETGAPLHTNFKLKSSGEYLALVAPDGRTVVQDYGALFPPQAADFSYGLAMNGSRTALVVDGASAAAHVPSSGGLGLDWTDPGFDDASWMHGSTGVGYDRGSGYEGLINLDVEDAMEGTSTSVYIRVPFQVADASQTAGLSLRMKYDDGFIAYVNGERIASANAPGSGSWNSEATSLHDDSEAMIFENFSVTLPAGVLRTGTNVLAIHGLNDNIGSSDFVIVPELDGYNTGELDRDVIHYFDQPSPGYSNLPGFPEISEQPVISPEGTVFRDELEVVMSVDSPETEIHYTRDGSEPDAGSPLYTGPFTIDTSTLIRAKGIQSGISASPTVSMGYIALAGSVHDFSSDLPVVVIDNFGEGRPPKEPKEPGFMAIFEPGGDGRTRLIRESVVELPEISNRIGIEVRGSSTAGRPKASFSFEFRDEDDDDIDFRPLGFTEESDWILYGAYNFDRALMRNPLIYELSNQVGRYAARSRFVELFFNMNGGDLSYADYMGVYSFMEKIKQGEWRVDIEGLSGDDNEEPDVSGGYIVKVDRPDPGDSGFGLDRQGRVLYYYPKEDEVTGAQADWIQSYFQEFEDVLFGAGFKDPVNGYRKYVDPASLIDHHILNIMPMNVDALRLSGYFHKNRSGRIEYGPIWDFDRTMGSTDGRDDNPFRWDGTGDSSMLYFYSRDGRFPWWYRLFQDDDFMQLWIDRWFMFREDELSITNIHGVIEDMRATLREAHERNFQKWSNIISPWQWDNEVRTLEDWLSDRVSWIDSHFLMPPRFSSEGGRINAGFELTVSPPSGGTVYYTLDGSDPREPGGGVSGEAMEYSGGPIVIGENTIVKARARRTSGNWRWSALSEDSYIVDPVPLVITEIMYHPGEPEAGSPHEDNDFEFIEILNRGSGDIDLSGVRFTDGIEFVITFGTVLKSGQYALVVKNSDAFMSRYDNWRDLVILGEYSGSLENRGERIAVSGPFEETILDFTYDDLWYPSTDGLGYALVVEDAMDPTDPWDNKESWKPGGYRHGTPGEQNSGGPGPGGWQLPGDMNQDGSLDLSDAIRSLLHLFANNRVPLPCEGDSLAEKGNLKLFDVNGDEEANIADVIYTLQYLFQGGDAPAEGIECVLIRDCPQGCGF